jgi:hypothetical protein
LGHMPLVPSLVQKWVTAHPQELFRDGRSVPEDPMPLRGVRQAERTAGMIITAVLHT